MSPAIDGSRFGGPGKRVLPRVPVTLGGLDGRQKPDPQPQKGAGVAPGVLAAAACVREPLAQFPGRRPCPGIPAVGVPALPAAVGGGILGAGGQFPPSRPPEPPSCAASFNSMGRGVPPEPAAPGPGQRPPTVAAEASSGCVGGSGCGEGALRPAPLSPRTRSSKSPALPRLSAPRGWVCLEGLSFGPGAPARPVTNASGRPRETTSRW